MDQAAFERRFALVKRGVFTGVLLGLILGCAEEPAPRFDAPLASGVLMLPLGSAQRFDAQLSANGLLAAMRGHGAPGLEVEALGGEIVLAHLPRSAFRAAILGEGVSAYNALAEAGYSLVIGSGFVSVFNPVRPLGLLQLQGDVKSDLTPHGYTRVLGAKNDDLRVIPREDFHPGLFDSAIQVGPGIVQDGKLDILQRERKLPPHIRAFVATCSDRWLAGIAHAPMHLYDLGERLLEHFAANRLRCDEVVNLSGDREALLAIRSPDGKSMAYFGVPTLPKASIIAFAAASAPN